jgi:hypothetical protein
MNDALAMMATRGTITPAAKSGSLQHKKPMVLIADIIILSAATATCGILPAPIVLNFPHIQMQLGSKLDDPDCPIVHCIVDTAAAHSTGNFHFVATVAKRYPHCVAKLYIPKDYNPIVLSGIFQCCSESFTTKLMVGFQFHLPCLTKEGNPTSILITTGPHVTVKMIVGLLFIQATRAIIDLLDNVADLHALDAPPFPLEFHCAMVHVPVMEGSGQHLVYLTNTYANMISEINALKHYFNNTRVATATTAIMENGHGTCSVRFGSSPPATPQPALTLKKPGFVADLMDHYGNIDMGVNIEME